MTFDDLQQKIDYKFRDEQLLRRALTLASASAENNNQTLECFGDAVLEFIVTEKLYFECAVESEITDRRKTAVSDEALSLVSKSLGLDELFIKSKGDVNNKKAIPSAYEALVAAVYLDGGMEAAKKLVLSTVNFTGTLTPENDSKTMLQEILQARGLPLPEYTRKELGTPQQREFEAGVTVYGKTFYGRASSVKGAEKQAAKKACEYLRGYLKDN